MQKHDLADKLRQRQYEYGHVERAVVAALSDDEIIDSYITCSCCGEREVESAQLPSVIAAAHDVDCFFELCQQQSVSH